ncbi:hypothetical protein, partial [Campylobacter hyointestinalis]
LANQSAINDAKLELFAKINAMKNFFWNYKIDMFADMNATDISNNTVFQPNTSLVVDTNFINKVYGDLFMGQNNFNANQLRVYIADNYIIADVREY